MKQKYTNVDKALFIFLFLNILLGIVIAPDYGVSWDEAIHEEYAVTTVEVYKNPSIAFNDNESVFGPSNLRYYGPFFTTVSYSISKIAGKLLPQWHPAASLHYVYFLTFLLGVYWLYRLSKHIMSEWAAFGVAILFATQPLLFGHAFINPKDTPFMVFFIGGIYFGIKMVDEFSLDKERQEKNMTLTTKGLFLCLKDSWVNQFSKKAKKRGVLIFSIWASLLILFFVFKDIIYYPIIYFIELVFNTTTEKNLFLQPGLIIISFFVVGFMYLFYYFVSQFNLLENDKPNNKKGIQKIKTLFVGIVKSFSKNLPSAIWKNLKNKNVIVAGMFLGLVSSIRVLGPFVGVLIIYYFFLRSKEKAVPTTIAYIIIGLITCYFAWPYLWSAPFLRFIESVEVMADFPWDNFVLFDGQRYKAFDLPRIYLPWLVTIQFSEPLIVLAGLGGLISLIIIISNYRQVYKEYLQIAILWIGLPFMGLIVIKPVMYDNFRQFLFIMPPLFIFAGIALDAIYQKIKPKWITILMSIALILPAIFVLIRLHPYQYIYFNSFVGGASGAFRSYEMDYWMTAFKEAAEFLNQHVPDDSKIATYGPDWLITGYLDKEFDVVSSFDLDEQSIQAEYDFQIIPTRSNYDRVISYFGEVIFSVEIDGVKLLDIVKIE